MKITCPKDAGHKQFITVVHVTEDWIVDNTGTFEEIHPASEAVVVAGPTIGNTFTCHECGAEAKAE